ncbi:MAG: TIGR04282 family arsenosugar biosynthesis glycosyltransferase [Rhodospirillales bacterium]|nr:TIGR04282 family arsenosugar biosynthesis glycosyltransferase [Rhodospirillales bacterium]MCY4003624.1 TIGR04282 family arsenosugar biosynthesis glycosyltransferase [Rhodospirillales bacterium]
MTARLRPMHQRVRRHLWPPRSGSPHSVPKARSTLRPTVLVFARQPVIGTVKTRLAADIGRVEALRFYRATLAGLLRRLASDRTWRTMLAVTPDHACRAMARTFRVPVMPQGAGDLGMRMRRAAGRQPGPALIVGSDVPDLEASHVRAALAALRRHDFVFGPAADGGYWLAGFGNRRPAGPAMLNVRWSTSAALADSVRSAGPRARVHVLADVLADVDDGGGYVRHLALHSCRHQRGRRAGSAT